MKQMLDEMLITWKRKGEFGAMVVESTEEGPGAQCEGHGLLLPGGHWDPVPQQFPSFPAGGRLLFAVPTAKPVVTSYFHKLKLKKWRDFPRLPGCLVGERALGHWLSGRALSSKDAGKS